VALLKESDRVQLQQEFARMTNSVKLVFFTQALDCEYCPLTQQVLEELVGLSNQIQLETHNFATDKDAVAQYKIARAPAVAVVRVEPPSVDGAGHARARDYGIRYYGVPAGFEFAALIGDILDVSAGESGLSAQSKAALKEVKESAHLQVFTTPSCPHCPTAVRLAHRMAMESEWITADAIEVSEFPELADRYQIFGVPLTVANETVRVEGGMPEPMFVPQVLNGLKSGGKSAPKILLAR